LHHLRLSGQVDKPANLDIVNPFILAPRDFQGTNTQAIELVQQYAKSAERVLGKNGLEVPSQPLVNHGDGSCLDHCLQPFFDGHLLSSVCSGSFGVLRPV